MRPRHKAAENISSLEKNAWSSCRFNEAAASSRGKLVGVMQYTALGE